MSNEINNMVDAGIIQPVESPIEGVQCFQFKPSNPEATAFDYEADIRELKQTIKTYEGELRKHEQNLQVIRMFGQLLLGSESFIQEIAEQVRDVIKDEIDYDTLAEYIDHGALASELCYSDLAYELDYSNLAQEFCISDIVEELDTDEIAKNIDLSELAEHFSIDVRVNR